MNKYNITDVINRLRDNSVLVVDINFSARTFYTRCPICGDSRKDPNKGHVKVFLSKDEFRCYRCGDFYGDINKLFSTLGIKIVPKKYISDNIILDVVKDSHTDKEALIDDMFGRAKKYSKEYIESSIIDIGAFRKKLEFRESLFYKKALKYMCDERGFDKDFIKSNKDKFIVGSDSRLVTDTSRYNSIRKTFGRINFISSNNIFVQGRSFLDTIKRKYYIYHKNIDKEENNDVIPDVIFFKTQNDSILVIVEGPFDAFRLYSLGISSVSIQGKAASNLINAINNFSSLKKDICHFKEYCILLDNDVSFGKKTVFCDELSKNNIFENIFVASLPKGLNDPGDILSFYDLKNIISHKKHYSDMFKLANNFNNMLGGTVN